MDFKFDPITLVVVLMGFIGTWYAMKGTVKWHSTWIKQHDSECDEQRKANNEILTRLQVNQESLTRVCESAEHRIDRLEKQFDRRTV